MYAVVRLKGTTDMGGEEKGTLEMLNLKRKFNCTLVPENKDFEGMLQKVENSITWGEIKENALKKMLRKRVKKKDDSEVEELSKKLLNGKTMKELGLKPTIPLSPPSGGFKGSTKKTYPDGAGGYRGDNINELLERMI